MRTRDGSILLAKNPIVRDGALILNGSPFRNYRIARDDLIEIRNGEASDILTQAWAKVDNAPPEKKPMLLATVENVGRILHLRKQVQIDETNLREAMKLVTEADAAKVESSAKRQRFLQDWKRLQDVWKQKNREYWKTRSNKSRMTSKARQEQMAVARAERALENYKRTLNKHTSRLGVLEKAAREKPERDMRRDRESYMRSINRADRDILKAQKILNDARRDNDKILAETKLLPAEEKSAKQTLDQAKKDADQAMQAYRKTIVDYQVSSRQSGIARGKVTELQQKKDQATQELEKLRSITPAIEPGK